LRIAVEGVAPAGRKSRKKFPTGNLLFSRLINSNMGRLGSNLPNLRIPNSIPIGALVCTRWAKTEKSHFNIGSFFVGNHSSPSSIAGNERQWIIQLI